MLNASDRIEARTDYIRQLTESLSSSSSTPALPRQNSEVVIDDTSSNGEITTSVLYKYGREIPSSVRPGALKNSIPSLGKQRQAHVVQTSTEVSNELRTDTVDPENASVTEEAHLQFLTNKDSRPQKIVSGSQFRNITKAVFHRCEQCGILDRANKKHKETLRTLRLQIARLEEQCHDLRRSKNTDAAHYHIASKAAQQAIDSGLNTEGEEYLSKQCEMYEEELNKIKKILTFERTANEGLRNTLEEARNTSKQELTDAHAEITRLRADLDNARGKADLYRKHHEESMVSLLQYKQQLEKAENKLSDCML